jgi:hypothetical protein
MRRTALSVVAALATLAFVTGCAAAPSGERAPGTGSAVATADAAGQGGGAATSEDQPAALTSGWIEAYAKSDGDAGKAVAAYATEHASGRFQDEWDSGDMAYVMRSYAVMGTKGDARTAKVTVRYDITSLREPATTPDGKPRYVPASPFEVTYTWIKTPRGWQLDQVTKTSDGSDFGAPVVYGR